jgi:hypothetical protein
VAEGGIPLGGRRRGGMSVGKGGGRRREVEERGRRAERE